MENIKLNNRIKYNQLLNNISDKRLEIYNLEESKNFFIDEENKLLCLGDNLLFPFYDSKNDVQFLNNIFEPIKKHAIIKMKEELKKLIEELNVMTKEI